MGRVLKKTDIGYEMGVREVAGRELDISNFDCINAPLVLVGQGQVAHQPSCVDDVVSKVNSQNEQDQQSKLLARIHRKVIVRNAFLIAITGFMGCVLLVGMAITLFWWFSL